MRRPESLFRVAGFAALISAITAPAQAQPPELEDNWYRTELLIFVRTDDESLAAEAWEPLPDLSYPDSYRHFLDPALADRRVAETGAYASHLDELGFQELLVPAPSVEIQDHTRPDAMTIAPDIPFDPNTPFDPNAPFDHDFFVDPDRPDAITEAGDPNAPLAPDPNTPDALAIVEDSGPRTADFLRTLPYQLLDRDQLEFRAQARTLRRRGQRVLFHGSWWSQLDERDRMPALVVDRSADMDVRDWPALQGSVLIYRSRYLHIDLDLWLNTNGEYLPDAWQIDPPPQPSDTLSAATLRGEPLNPWQPVEEPPPETELFKVVDESNSPAPDADDEIPGAGDEDPFVYPWRHAITQRQARRMRSNEIHYIDHPIIGVVVKITPASDELLPFETDEEAAIAFRERHQLPLDYLTVELEESDEDE